MLSLTTNIFKAAIKTVSNALRHHKSSQTLYFSDVSISCDKSCSSDSIDNVKSLLRKFVRRYRSQLKRRYEDDYNVSSHYWIEGILGVGAYGSVAQAYDVINQRHVAIKKTEYRVGKNYSAVRELNIMNHLSEHQNFITLHSSECDKLDLYLVTDVVPIDLFGLIYDANYNLTADVIRSLIYQTLLAAQYMHDAGILHLDLKPSNLLVTNTLQIKVCDFGLSRAISDDGKATSYVTTRNYRPPELLLDQRKYGKQVDVWSIGCILAEMFARRVFFDGETSLEVMEQIVTMQPGITAEDINGQSYLVEHIKAVLKLKLYRYRTLRDALPNASDLAVDLISKMLTFDPKYRITAADALKHPYFEGLYQPSDVIVPPIYTL